MNGDNGLLQDIADLSQKVESVKMPDDLKKKVNEMLARLQRSANYGSYAQDYERVAHYVNWIVQIPWDKSTQDNIDLASAKAILDKHHYGIDSVKQRILEYLAIVKLNLDKKQLENFAHAPILCLVGLAGTGKTTFAYGLAEAMGRKIARIPFGGMGSARDLRGQSRLHLEAEPGAVIKAMVDVGTKNPIILLDEIDRVAAEVRADIMGVLLELLDPGQNKAFVDHYLDYPVDLSQVMFVATANNTDNVSTAVKNRLEVISMPTYSDEEKIIIAKDYVLPDALKEAGLPENALTIDDSVWPEIVRPLGYDSGIRLVKRAIEGIVRKVAFMVVQGQAQSLHIDQTNLREYVEQPY